MADDQKQLDSFLSKVDEIESIVRGLATGSENEASEAIDKADQYLRNIRESEAERRRREPRDNTGVNRTVINQKAFDDATEVSPGDHMGPGVESGMDQDAFMAAMEADAIARSERKKKARQEATAIKDMGNKEFQAGNYDKAVEYYTLALGKAKDITALWTNRAQAYIKLGEYEKALSDCDWALRVFENCVKAYVHQGRAHLGLKQYDKATESYEKAMKCDPKKENVLRDYIAEVERTRLTDEQLEAAQEFSKTGAPEAQDIPQLLKRITKEDQLPMYYSGGIRILENMITNANEKTFFRTNGGITLPRDHFLIARCFAASPRSLSRDELMLCSSTIDCLQRACAENDENQKQLLELPELPDQLLRFLESKHRVSRHVRQSVVKLIHILSETTYGRSLVVAKFDLPRLLTCLFPLMRGSNNTGSLASGLLRNLALDKKFRAHFRGDIDQNVLPNFEALMTDENSTLSVLPACTGVMTNLCGDDTVRKTLVNRTETWAACCAALERFTGKRNQPITDEILESLLSLVMNMTYESSENAKQSALRICKSCCSLMTSSEPRSGSFEKRILGATSRVLPLDGAAVTHVCDSGVLPLLVSFLQKDDIEYLKPALRCIVSCTQQHAPARTQVIDCSKGLSTIVGLLKHEDESVVGNAALCLSHLTDLPKVPEKLTKTNIIQHLLVLTRDGRKEALMENCAILTAKLAQADTRHLERLRELHGIEILHSAMKYVKS